MSDADGAAILSFTRAQAAARGSRAAPEMRQESIGCDLAV
jgi:hypothetical protein